MRVLILIWIVTLTISCSLQAQQINFDKSKIAKINLLVGDSVIFNEWQDHQDSGLAIIHWNVYFVDSTGKALHNPMQTITFTDAGKDSLLDIMNSFSQKRDDTLTKSCIAIFRHSMLCYSADDKLIAKADICFDCATIISTNLKSEMDLQQNMNAYHQLVNLFKSRNAYLYHAHEE